MNPYARPAEGDNLLSQAGPRLVEGLGTLFSALGAMLTVLHFTGGMGFPSEARRALMLTFNLSRPTNTLFQYAVALATIFAVGALDARVLARRMAPVARRLDLLAAAALVPVVWWTPLDRLALTAFGARVVVAAGLAAAPGRARVELMTPLARLAAWAPAIAGAVALDLLSLLLPPGLNTAVAGAPAWLLALVIAPVLLFFAEELAPSGMLVWLRRVGIVLVLIAIPLITFKTESAYFDPAIIIGPVNDIMLGKDLPNGVVSTYGFLFVYFLAAVFRVFRVSDPFLGLSLVNSLAFSVGYAAIFVFLLRRVGRLSLCIAAMTLLVAIHFFHLHVPIGWLPQVGFLRFGAVLPVFLLLYVLEERPQSRRLEMAFAVTTAVALFWTIEVGVYVALGLAGAFGRALLLRTPGDRTVFRLVGKLMAAVGGVLALVTLRVVVRHGHLPAWADLLHFQRAYSAGLAMVALKTFERWPIPIIIYIVTALVALTAPRARHGGAWIFLALFGLAAMAYPLGKTGIFDLSRVVLPALLLAFAFVGFVVENGDRLYLEVQGRSYRLATAAAAGLFVANAALTCLTHADAAPQLEIFLAEARDHRKPIAESSPSWQAFVRTPANRAAFERDIAAIAELVPPDEGLPILSKNDTLYYVFAHRTAIYKNSFYPHFFYKADIDRMVEALLTSKVGYMFLDNSGFQAYENGIDHQIANQVWARVSPHYRFVRHAGLLDVYERLPTTK
jgi:hypothetical protein